MSRFFDNEIKRQMSKIMKEVQKESTDEESKKDLVKEALMKGMTDEKIMRKYGVGKAFILSVKAELDDPNLIWNK